MRRKKIIKRAGDQPFIEVRSGGPTKFFNLKKVRRLFPRSTTSGFEPVEAPWLRAIIALIPIKRAQLHLSQQALARLLKTTQSEVSRMERGLANPTAEQLNQYIKTLGIRIKIES